MQYLLSPYYEPGVVLEKKHNDQDKSLLSGNLMLLLNQSFQEWWNSLTKEEGRNLGVYWASLA